MIFQHKLIFFYRDKNYDFTRTELIFISLLQIHLQTYNYIQLHTIVNFVFETFFALNEQFRR